MPLFAPDFFVGKDLTGADVQLLFVARSRRRAARALSRSRKKYHARMQATIPPIQRGIEKGWALHLDEAADMKLTPPARISEKTERKARVEKLCVEMDKEGIGAVLIGPTASASLLHRRQLACVQSDSPAR